MQNAFTRTRRIISDIPTMSAPNYVGPGDLGISGAISWVGLRAFSAATIGAPCVEVRRQSDNAITTLYTRSNGLLDANQINSFMAGSTLWVRKLYDQSNSGNFFFIFSDDNAHQPNLITSPVLALSFPNPAANATVNWFPVATYASPLTVAGVAQFTANASGNFSTIWADIGVGGSTFAVYFRNTAADGISLWGASGALELNLSVANGGPAINTWSAFQGVFNGLTNSIMASNGSLVTGDSGGGNVIVNGSEMEIGGDGVAADNPTMYFRELGFWTGAFSLAQIAAMNGNQRGAWGF